MPDIRATEALSARALERADITTNTPVPGPNHPQRATMNELIEQAVLAPLELLAQHLLTVLPNIFAMGVLILGGLLTAWLSSMLLERFLRVIGLDHLSNRLGTTTALLRAGIKTDPTRLIGQTLYWSIALFSLIAGLSALNLKPINQFAQSMLTY